MHVDKITDGLTHPDNLMSHILNVDFLRMEQPQEVLLARFKTCVAHIAQTTPHAAMLRLPQRFQLEMLKELTEAVNECDRHDEVLRTANCELLVRVCFLGAIHDCILVEERGVI